MSEERTFTLPDADTMLKRLHEVSESEYLVMLLYPSFTKHAGEEYNPLGLATMVMLAVHECARGEPEVVVTEMYMLVDDFISALVLNRELADEALQQWTNIQAMGLRG